MQGPTEGTRGERQLNTSMKTSSAVKAKFDTLIIMGIVDYY